QLRFKSRARRASPRLRPRKEQQQKLSCKSSRLILLHWKRRPLRRSHPRRQSDNCTRWDRDRSLFIDMNIFIYYFENSSNQDIFRFKCVVGGREFIGAGKNKKDAKNQAATQALDTIFNMSVETVEEDEDVEEKINSVDDATCAFVRSQYEIICALNGITPSSDFACFVIWSILNNEIKLISIGSSTQDLAHLEEVAESGGKKIVHHNSVIYARRAAVRFFIDQLAKAEKGKEDSCLEPIGRMFRLKPSLRLSIVTSQPVDIRFSAPKSAEQRLSVYGKDNLLECISEVPDDKEEPRVHSVVDKILKWCNLGVQGALLTTRLHPIIPSSILTMTRCPLPNQSYLHLLTSRVCPPPLPINVYSAKMDLPFAESHAHLWSHADAKMEVLSETGTTADGAASSCSKHSLYKAFLAATPRFP
ncbi:hypothetical protein PENTCL1PPCAC_4212, partial [Pristionchus entomophagus]